MRNTIGKVIVACDSLLCHRLLLLLLTGCLIVLTACGSSGRAETPGGESTETPGGRTEIPGGQLAVIGQMELNYADQFAVDYLKGGYCLIRIADGLEYLTIPEGAPLPDKEQLPEGNYTMIQLPVEHIYLAASSAMDLIRELKGLDSVSLTGTRESDWSLSEIVAAMESGSIGYGGKYNAPDYEQILSADCDLAIESTMIYHMPEVKEALEQLGLPVLVERSSYESHPLGRAEWIRLYGLLLGKEEEAAAFVEDCKDRLEQVEEQVSRDTEENRPEVAFFYVHSNGTVNVRKPGDYISHMIGMAGGDYVFSRLPVEDNALSTMNIDMETCYELARDADILIYNSTVGAELTSLDELLTINPLFADFKAVQTGNVWCTGQNLYQETTGAAAMVEDLYRVFRYERECRESGEGQDSRAELPQLTYLHKLS